MRQYILYFLLFCVCGSQSLNLTKLLNDVPTAKVLDMCFVPYDDNCQDVIIKYINNTKTMIHLAIYTFGAPDIAKALKGRDNVWKYIVIDKYTADTSWGQFILDILKEAKKIKVYECITRGGALMHNKFMVFDGKILQTGSVNYSGKGLNHNYENLIVLESDQVTSQYVEYFDYILNNSKLLFENK